MTAVGSLKRAPSWQGVQSARQAAFLLHAGQTDFQGQDYASVHVASVALELVVQPAFEALGDDDRLAAQEAAWLHDVVEDRYPDDHERGYQVLEALGVPGRVLEALRALTHGEGEPRAAYIARIVQDPVAKAVKQADNRVNLRRSKSLPPYHEQKARLVAKYESEGEVLFA